RNTLALTTFPGKVTDLLSVRGPEPRKRLKPMESSLISMVVLSFPPIGNLPRFVVLRGVPRMLFRGVCVTAICHDFQLYFGITLSATAVGSNQPNAVTSRPTRRVTCLLAGTQFAA